MKLIAHRGLFQGPDKDLENKPEQILAAVEQGYDCEIDLRVIDGELWLGHDAPTYKIDKEFLTTGSYWIHAKNLEALRWLYNTDYNFFWHQEDDFVITSQGYIWTYPEKPLTDKSVRLMPEWADPTLTGIETTDCFAICSDYVELIKYKFELTFQRNVVLDLIG